MRVIVTKKQFDWLMKESVEEERRKNQSYFIDPQKVLIVKKYLDCNFKRGTMSKMSDNGYPIVEKIIGMKDSNGTVIRNLSIEQMYDLLDDKFHHIYTDSDKRMKFIKKVLNDWVNKKISNEGLLSSNSY